MKSAVEHYDTHLARIYAWLAGDAMHARRRAAAELADMGLAAGEGAQAIDLGAGLGLHSVVLAQLGYRVLAIDASEAMMVELRARCDGLDVRAVRDDLTGFAVHLQTPAHLILCLGDTLTHLPSLAAVDALFDAVRNALAPGGVFAASFRDYASHELGDERRYILVKRDEERVLTCLLEYGSEKVTVRDILTERREQQWQQTESSYLKLRLAPTRLVESLTARGLEARLETAPGDMVRIVARRPA